MIDPFDNINEREEWAALDTVLADHARRLGERAVHDTSLVHALAEARAAQRTVIELRNNLLIARVSCADLRGQLDAYRNRASHIIGHCACGRAK